MIRNTSYKTNWGWRAALLVFSLGVAGGAHAELKIGFVNVPRLLEESPQAQSAMQILQEEFAPRQREIVTQQEQITSFEESLRRDGPVMSDDERRSTERRLRDAQRELGRLQNEYVEDLNIRRNEALGELQRSLLQEVQDYARGSGYDLVVSDGVLFASQQLDITQEVLAGLQSRFQSEAGDATSGN